jgi:hypothetical protein
MNCDAKQYIESELELSRLRMLSLLNSKSLSDTTKKRLVDIEVSLQDLNFSSLKIVTLSDAMTAIRLFRSSRKNFSQLYIMDEENFLNKINLFIDKHSQIPSEKLKISKVKSLLKTVAIAKSTKDILNHIKLNVEDKLILNKIVVDFITSSKNEVFSIYNDNLKIASELFIEKSKKDLKINYLKDLVKEQKNSGGDFLVEKINFYGKNGWGIILPTKNCGRETLWAPYTKISIFGNDLSNLFKSDVKNTIKNGEYFKTLVLKDIDTLKDNNNLLSKYYFLMSLIFQNSLSKRDQVKISIDMEESKILIPSSRTEDEGLRNSMTEFFNLAKTNLESKKVTEIK